ncbi:MAG: shikimate dehydrogenase [Gammaproteobacteria bacterium]|nr:MAG: shikimate dehydrogenase [Gammaproteobacteria bacterium]
MDRYAVVGHPVTHSKSPRIHAAFAQQTAQALSYDAMDVAPGHFDADVAAFFAQGGKGLNVTVPYKEEAYRFADRLTRRARQAGAVNTLAKQADGSILGDNTDGIGLVRDMVENQGWSLQGKRVLLLGAGGAVRGVLGPLLEQQPARIVIANRTASKAVNLAIAFGEAVTGCGYDALAGQVFDVVINGTSASLAGEMPPLPDTVLAAGAACYDMMYGNKPTVFLQWARQHGAKTADGLGMLVEQAAESFTLWRDVRPQTAPVLATLRAS